MDEKLLEIINYYGVIHQLKYFQSEIFELTEAIFLYEEQKRNCYNRSVLYIEEAKEHIAEEIADVMVMLSQFKKYYHIDDNEVLKIMNKKIKRQLKRIEEERKNEKIEID